MDNLDQQFFQFAMTYRDPYKQDALTAFANLLEADSGFPRSHSNYADLADYLELSGEYTEFMDTFDEMYQEYIERKEQANKTTTKSEEI